MTSPYAHLSASREVQVEELTLEAAEERFRFSELTVLGQLFATYIVAKSSEGLYLIDQHAAHERVLFEQILHTRAKREADSQLLLSPLIIESARQADHEEMAPVQYLQELGYDIEAFGPKEYILKAIPTFLEEDAARRFAQTVLEEGQQKGGPSALDLDKVAMQACKEAVKGNDRLDHDEILALFDSLDRADQPFSCPHGRPTFLRLSQGDLEKMFQRR